ncbi:MAG: hypothetical protein HON76_19855 [Candidatus Scalindua sp.]|nr:hypothetical protein [Candidatus Scalindua sp.]MBT5305898.1 hypothetical protein [Candidatus Scalindua sp.]MBT6052005.1 hypothetical protein [Candidatus Scalindua sp.]MBT6229148.1 hypothetical protein [Candidatus Scalindua sp.]MBT6564775.1 hypothetical protein [Candidatus Scalindua sp.]
MPTTSYQHIITEIKELDLSDQLRLLEEMAGIIRSNASPLKTRSILELQGKGKDIWENIDAQEYIDKERSSWSG